MAITKYLPASINQTVTYVRNGFSCDTTETQYSLQRGVPIQNLYTFSVIPASESNTCVSASQAWPGASTSYTLNTNATVDGTEIITAPITINGETGIELDCERSVSMTMSSATTAITYITITGYDYRGVAQSNYYGIVEGASGTFTFDSPIAIVTSITASANPGVNLSFGNASGGYDNAGIGLPYYLAYKAHIISCTYGGVTVDPSTNITVGKNWRISAPTSITDDPARGYIELPSESDGTSMLVVTYLVYGSDGEINNQLQNRIQSTRGIVQVQQNSSDEYVWPNLTTYDEVGMQYPGDLTAATEYNTLIAA